VCSPFVAVNQIFGIKRCLIFCLYAFILILHNEATHQDEMVYLGITLAFFTDSLRAIRIPFFCVLRMRRTTKKEE